MTLLELSAEYRTSARELKERILVLQQRRDACRSRAERTALDKQLQVLSSMQRDAMELAALTEHYYDRGYHSNERYKI